MKKNSREEFLKRLGQLDPDLASKIKNGEFQICDYVIFNTKCASGLNSFEPFEAADAKTKGLRNINARKLEKDSPFLMLGIRITYGIGEGKDDEHGKVVAFGVDELPPVIANGEMSMSLGTKVVMPEKFPLAAFVRAGADTPKGLYLLDSPKFLKPQEEIKIKYDFAGPAAENAWIRTELIGAIAVKV